MRTPYQITENTETLPDIPTLVTADEVAKPLGVTGRTILNWAASETIPTALRIGKVVRFDAAAVAKALGLAK